LQTCSVRTPSQIEHSYFPHVEGIETVFWSG
jgi:hypothetical protein